MFITFLEMFSPGVNIDIHCEKIEVLQEKSCFQILRKWVFELLLLMQNVDHISDHLLRRIDKMRKITYIWKHNKVT